MISIVIPAFNEEAVLKQAGESLAEELTRLSPGSWEILIVDDGSSDRTREIAEQMTEDPRFHLVRHVRNRGKGAAVRTGVLHSRGTAVVVFDADMSTGPEMLEPFLAELARGAHLVTGDRHSPASKILRPQSLLRRALGRGYAAMARRVSGTRIQDFNCGFKVFEGDVARTLLAACQSDRWTWDVEVIARATRRGWDVRTLPVTWRQGNRSSVRVLGAVTGSFRELALLWYRLTRERG